ncbi:nuclease-related domain-containing protein [Bacillaceae bacterium S4-13-56]
MLIVRKERCESDELQVLRSLDGRAELDEKDVRYLGNLVQGYEGEVWFDQYLGEWVSSDSALLCDLLLEVNHTHVQLDTLLVGTRRIYLFEVKNYEGDYVLDGDKMVTRSGIGVNNPFHQVSRAEQVLKRMLQQAGIQMAVESMVVFVNPGFYLYNAGRDLPAVFYPQLSRFFVDLNRGLGGSLVGAMSGGSGLVQKQERIVKQLLGKHIAKSPFSNVPSYSYNRLKKGVLCPKCGQFMTLPEGKFFLVCRCGCMEKVDSAVLRCVAELKLLFPDRRITTSTVYDWCGGVISSRTIVRVLKAHYKKVGDLRFSHYINS